MVNLIVESKKLIILNQDSDYILGKVDVYNNHVVSWKTFGVLSMFHFFLLIWWYTDVHYVTKKYLSLKK